MLIFLVDSPRTLLRSRRLLSEKKKGEKIHENRYLTLIMFLSPNFVNAPRNECPVDFFVAFNTFQHNRVDWTSVPNKSFTSLCKHNSAFWAVSWQNLFRRSLKVIIIINPAVFPRWPVKRWRWTTRLLFHLTVLLIYIKPLLIWQPLFRPVSGLSAEPRLTIY